jgi:hypothetical protein
MWVLPQAFKIFGLHFSAGLTILFGSRNVLPPLSFHGGYPSGLSHIGSCSKAPGFAGISYTGIEPHSTKIREFFPISYYKKFEWRFFANV